MRQKHQFEIMPYLQKTTYADQETIRAGIKTIAPNNWLIPNSDLVGKTLKVVGLSENGILLEEVKE